jgi:hypothetical protein
MKVLKKKKDDERSVGCLVIGVENNQVLILDASAANIYKKVFTQVH